MISVIICTRNNKKSLSRTLDRLSTCASPQNISVEIIVADNGSRDCTRSVVEDATKQSKHPIKYVFEERVGKSNAQNRGVEKSRGDVLVFTDDDVLPDKNWICDLVEPILNQQADIVGGGVEHVDALRRPWLTFEHQCCVASTTGLDENAEIVVGANMAIARRVLLKVPAFDPKLGPGALGFAEETLFVKQAKEAGFRIYTDYSKYLIHAPSQGRIRYENWIDSAGRQGRSGAYIAYHWQHLSVKCVRLKATVTRFQLAAGRALRIWRYRDPERAHPREMALTSKLAFLKYLLFLRGSPRNYELRGLARLQRPAD